MDTKYTPTAGEQQMLGDFNNRMADINRVAQSAGAATLPDQNQQQPAVDPFVGMSRSEVAQYTNDPAALNRAATADSALRDARSTGLRGVGTGFQGYDGAATALAQIPTSILPANDPRRRVTAFADGGKPETAEELIARIKAKYNVSGDTTQAPAPAAAPSPRPQAQQERQPGGLLQQTVGILNNHNKQIEQAAKGYANGGELSDDQLAERSVSAVARRALIRHRQKQNAEIEQAVKVKAHARGGKIKGPGTPTSDSIPATVPDTGESILVSTDERILSKKQDDLLLRIAKAMGFETVDQLLEAGTGEPVGPTMRQGKAAAATGMAPTEETLHNGPYTGDGASLVKDFKAWQSNKIAETNAKIDLATGKTPQASYSNEGRSVPTAVTTTEQHPVTVPASRASTAPAPAARVPGAKLISNLPDGVAAVDSSAAALIDQKNSTYNPARQLENMQRLRLTSDAIDPTITDPNVRYQAVQGLAILNAGRAGADASALAEENINQARTGSEMRSKLLDPNTPPEERTRMIQTLQAISGHAEKPSTMQVHDVEEPIDPKQPLLGNRKVPYLVDPRTGQNRPMLQSTQPQAQDATSQARAAIARGADPKAVNARLKQLGLPEVK